MKIIFDLDGTLANEGHRNYLAAAGKWDDYFAACDNDAPIPHAITVLQALAMAGHNVEVWSDRSEGHADVVRAKTIQWLSENGILAHINCLRMRPHKDHRKDTELKAEWYKTAGRPDLVFENRDQAVRMWREAGVPCFQVAPGEF